MPELIFPQSMYPAVDWSPVTTLTQDWNPNEDQYIFVDNIYALSSAGVGIMTLGEAPDAYVVSFAGWITTTGRLSVEHIYASPTVRTTIPAGTQVYRAYTAHDHNAFMDNIEYLRQVFGSLGLSDHTQYKGHRQIVANELVTAGLYTGTETMYFDSLFIGSELTVNATISHTAKAVSVEQLATQKVVIDTLTDNYVVFRVFATAQNQPVHFFWHAYGREGDPGGGVN